MLSVITEVPALGELRFRRRRNRVEIPFHRDLFGVGPHGQAHIDRGCSGVLHQDRDSALQVTGHADLQLIGAGNQIQSDPPSISVWVRVPLPSTSTEAPERVRI